MDIGSIKTLFSNKRFLLLLLVSAGVVGYFWSQSRYPQLDHKAMMGADIHLEAIGFDVLVPMPENPSVPRQIFVNSVNWMYTNLKGMTFGIIFGALLMSMLPFLVNFQFRSRFANSALGVVIGAPLGLCVNCSTPIATGMYARGSRPETMLATMISSPTLNVIVLTMLFTMFPPWLAVMKIGSTVAFVLIGIPLLTRWIKPGPLTAGQAFKTDVVSKTVEKHFADPLCELSDEQCNTTAQSETWRTAVIETIKNFGRNLLYLIKIAVPLMILAGVLGAAMVTLLPLDRLAGGLPDSRLFSWLSMGVLALVGLFLPSPMTFDVIVSAVLLNAGMPVKYVAILLFTLGIFSVYPFMMLWKYMSPRMAIAISAVLVVIGVTVGVTGNRYYTWDKNQQQLEVVEPFLKSANPPVTNKIDRANQGTPADQLLRTLEKTALRPQPHARIAGLDIGRTSFRKPLPAASDSKKMMRRYDQREFGITEHENYSTLIMMPRYSLISRGIASGDINRDGWTDLVVTSDSGFALYLNKEGKRFDQQRLDIPALNAPMIPSAALVDMNNDGWLDLWIATFRRGNFIIYSDKGVFSKDNLTAVPNQPDAVLTHSAAFGDIDRNGKLDIVMGNVSAAGKTNTSKPFKSTRNIWLRQVADGFKKMPLAGADGESLTSLLSDINRDGHLDLMIGNDLLTPDMVYFGDGAGGFRLVTKSDGLIPGTTNNTMSIASADLDNDLTPEIYFGAVARRDKQGQKGARRELTPKQQCAELAFADSRERCEKFHEYRNVTNKAVNQRNLWRCRSLPEGPDRDGCIATEIVFTAHIDKNKRICDMLLPSWESLSFICHADFAETRLEKAGDKAGDIPQVVGSNVLLKQGSDRSWEDRTAQAGLQDAGWTWNAKFADIDNDGWQDLFVANGLLVQTSTESNFYYRNKEGRGFEDLTEEAGLTSYLSTLAYTYLDIDNDGDLDIVAAPTVGPLSVYINQTSGGNSIAFELHDEIGNYYGIGSKIVINYGDGKHQMREIQASGGYLSYDAPIAYFGLGDVPIVKSVEIEWSTGEKTSLNTNFEAGARYTVRRPK